MTERGAAAGPPWPAGAAWIEGGFCPIEEAKISVLDLGVTRSDCTYDVVHVWRGRFYRLDAHLDRFGASLARLRLDPGHDRAAIEDILHGCVRRSELREAYAGPVLVPPRRPALLHPRSLRPARLKPRARGRAGPALPGGATLRDVLVMGHLNM